MKRWAHGVAAGWWFGAPKRITLAALLLIPAANAQEVLHEITGANVGDHHILGAALGDVDGDGHDDFAVSAYLAGNGDGAAWVYSGRTGAVLHTLGGSGSGELFGQTMVAIEDVDGDGVRDLVLGAPSAVVGGSPFGRLYLFSGATGSLIRTIDGGPGNALGGSLGRVGDLDNDGSGDFVTGGGNLTAYSGATGQVLFTIARKGVQSMAGIPDLDGDGHDEVLCGFPFESGPAGEAQMGWVRVYSGRNASLLFELSGAAVADRFGFAVDSMGDVNGDGVGDFLASAPYSDAGGNDAGSVFVYSGASRTPLQQFDGPVAGASFGRLAAAAGDANGDGAGDLVVGALGRTTVYLLSGRTGGTLYQFDPVLIPALDEVAIGPAGDVDADGLADFIHGSIDLDLRPPFPPLTPGVVRVLGGNDLFLQGTGESARVGTPFTLQTREGTPGAPSLLAVVALDGLPTFQLLGGLVPLDAAGHRLDQGTVPPTFAGVVVSFQSFTRGPNGLPGATAVLSVSFLP